MKKIPVFILLLLSICCFTVSSQKKNAFFFEHLSAEDGLSQISVTTIFQDSRRYMWFGTRDGLNRYNGNEFKVYKHDVSDSTSISDSYIRCIREDRRRNLWIGTTYGLNKLDAATGRFKRYCIQSPQRLFYQNEINCLFIDEREDVWSGTYNGLFKLDWKQDRLVKVEIGTDRIYDINHTGDTLLLATLNGLVVYDIPANKTTRYFPFSGEGSNVISTIFKDSKGNIWLGSRKRGLGRFDLKSKQIRESYSTENGKLSNDEIRDIKEDRKGNLLIATYDGLNVLDTQTGQVAVYNQNSKEAGSLSDYSVESICCDNAGTVWVGTYNGGINYHHKQSGRFRFYSPGVSINMPGITGPMLEDESGLWIGTEGNLIYFDIESQTFRNYSPPARNRSFKDLNVKCMMLKNRQLYFGVYTGWLYRFDTASKQYAGRIFNNGGAIYSIIEDPQGDLLLGTYSMDGLKRLKNNQLIQENLEMASGAPLAVEQISCLLQDEANSIFIGTRANGLVHYHDRLADKYSIDEKAHTIGGNKIAALFKDHSGKIWIGTADGGLSVLDKQTSTIRILTEKDGLKDNKICGITQDKSHRMWVTTLTGISEIDSTVHVVKTYDYSGGIRVFEFSQNSLLIASDNTIYAGGNNGFISFNPAELTTNDFIPPVVIDNILVNNQPIVFRQDDPVVLDLNYKEANIAIEYIALNYIYPKQNKYAYILEGVDHEWNYVGNVRKVNYANLQPGSYIFRVKGSNNDDVWNETGCAVHIRIAPPFWLTGWAFLFYFILGVSVVYSIIHYYKVRNDLRNEVLLKQEQETFHRARINLFTNFSHELRTPLSLIMGPLEDLMEDSSISHFTKNSLTLIYRNAQRMLSLVNELLDFRKKESGSLQLQVAAGDFGKFTEEIIIAFQELARNRNIQLHYKNNIAGLTVWYDRSLFEKVLLNLLSNAFKHTPAGGTVSVLLGVSGGECLKIEVEDTGSGISEDELEKIFDPFYQSPQNRVSSLNSSGIGLSLAKGIVEMHHGKIRAENRAGKGAVFQILLPLGKAHFSPHEIIEDYKDSENIKRYVSTEEPANDSKNYEMTGELHRKYTILVVDDNRELRHYIKQHIDRYYKVLEAENGKEGYRMAAGYIPDLIISDIMMPEVDGLQMTRQVKDDIRTCHIPVVLLTARTSILQMKEGLEFGADDYILKPFNASILLLKVKNILLSRENLKNLYGKGFALENMGVEIVSAEDRFLQKLCKVVEKNIAEPDLNIERFCTEIGMSRANLYRRIKAVTNLSPLEYVKTIRLNVASKMLKETDLSVTEISEKAGFNSLVGFSASFRKYYGLSPSKYAAEHKSNK